MLKQWTDGYMSCNSSHGQVATVASGNFSIWSQVKDQRSPTDHDVEDVCVLNLFFLIFHTALWFIQFWDGTEVDSACCCQTKALQCTGYYSEPYLPRVHEIITMLCLSHRKGLTLRKMLFCKWKLCLSDGAQTRVISTEYTCTPVHTQFSCSSENKTHSQWLLAVVWI